MISLCLKLFSLLSLLLFSALSHAAQPQTNSVINSGVLLETLFGLILVLSLIAFLAWLLRRTGSFNFAKNSDMHIVASLALGPRERAVLLQIGEKQILLGVTSQNVQTLHVLEQNIQSINKTNSSSSFAAKLQQIMQQKGQS